jgi:hypothetical protein
MPAAVTCPHCDATLKPKTPPRAGSRVRCPKCKAAFVVPGAGAPEEEELEAAGDEGEGGRDAPKGRATPKKRKKAVLLWVWIAAVVGGLFLVCGCGGVGLIAYNMRGGGGLFGPTVSMNNVKKLKRGMTVDEVERILGTPSRSAMLAGEELNVVWDGRNGDYITVIFGPDGKSKQAHYQITQGGAVTTDYITLP